jgi:hypothetical protein
MQIRSLTLEEQVHRALDRAVAKGHGDAIEAMADEEIALDLMLYDEHLKHDKGTIGFVPFVQNWRAKHAQQHP